ncbi:hypothetical protein QQF64_026621 [Cirrhinus molitorella]|uniref:Secreted protein n=1 Tax=Cirrhinus molitorella TaxID=172907 RepID=A0ABR3NAN5_9TELE
MLVLRSLPCLFLSLSISTSRVKHQPQKMLIEESGTCRMSPGVCCVIMLKPILRRGWPGSCPWPHPKSVWCDSPALRTPPTLLPTANTDDSSEKVR